MGADGDGLSLSFADLFLNVAVTMLVSGLLAVTMLDALTLPEAGTSAGAAAQNSTIEVLQFDLFPDGTLNIAATSPVQKKDLAMLDPATRLVAIFPAHAAYGAVTQKLREVSTITPATLEHVEYAK